MAFNNNTIESFFLLVRAGLFGRTEGIEEFLPDGVDWEEVYRLADEQSVAGLVADGIDLIRVEFSKTHPDTPLVPEDWSLRFVTVILQQEQCNLGMNRFVEQLIGRLQRRNVRAIL